MTKSQILAAVLAGGLCLPAVTEAQRGRGRRASGDDSPRITATLADLEELTNTLQSSDDNVVREAIDRLTVIDHPDIIPPLSALLRSGRSDRITDRALDALKAVAHPSAIDVLVEFANHRRVGARRRAYLALAEIDDPRIPALLTRGLRDSERTIRGTAALALGELGATDSIELLFAAFDRNVIEAAIAIGKLGNEASIERFNAYLGNEPLGVMLSGYDEYLRRDDISLEAKTAVVERLGEIAGVMVRQFLQNYLRWFPNRIRNRELRAFKALVEETISRIPDDAAQGGSR